MKLEVYIENLGKYNEGESTGAWFTLPVNINEVNEKIGLNEQYEEYFISDYDLPFSIGEYERLENLNRWANEILDLPSPLNECENCLKNVMRCYDDNFEYLLSHSEDITFYPGIDIMTDLAELLVDEGALGEIPDNLCDYIDYVAYARDLEINGCYAVTDCGIFNCPCY